jgi:hypothetical protein
VSQRRKYHPADFGERQWGRLLEFALERADGLECAVPYPVVVQDLAAAPLWPPELETFRSVVIDRHVSLVRWEVRQDFATQFVRFRMTPALRRYVRTYRHLEDWSWALGAPEDPTFYFGDHRLLATESVSGRIAVFASHDDVSVLTGVGIRLVEPLGVTAEPWPTP